MVHKKYAGSGVVGLGKEDAGISAWSCLAPAQDWAFLIAIVKLLISIYAYYSCEKYAQCIHCVPQVGSSGATFPLEDPSHMADL